MEELRYLVERRRKDYNHYGPHSRLGFISPAAPSIGSDSATLRQPQYRVDAYGILS
ncbi:MAG: hypothetical protein ABFD79_11180 [Phycisphaerales bacterium]